MKVIIRYSTLSSNNPLYFLDLRGSDEELRPIGCRPYRRKDATVFHSMAEARPVFDFLESSGRKPVFCKPGPRVPYRSLIE